MYEELVKRLRECGHGCNEGRESPMLYDKLVEATHERSIYRVCCSADEAADAIEELSREVDMDNDAMTAMDAAIPRWIPVGERLPQEREWVLCQCRAKIRMVLRLQNGYWHQDSRHEFMSGFVTHWMPLPEPPKEET